MTTKAGLNRAVEAHKAVVRNALQTVYDALNQGQKKKIVKNQDVVDLFDLYGVDYEGGGTA